MQTQSRLIGIGRHGEVRAIRHEHDSGWSAVKVIHAPVGGRSAATQPHDAVREARLLANLDHPNVIPLIRYKFLEEQLEHHLHLPLLPLGLHDLIGRPDGIPQELLRSTIFQVLLALAHLHGQDIAHRDIKPANILFDWDGTVKLIDFGTAWTAGDDPDEVETQVWLETKAEMCCSVGSGHYRAPELLFSPTTYDPFALDIWSLGVVITDCMGSPADSSKTSSDGSDPDSGSDFNSEYDPLEDSNSISEGAGRTSTPQRLFDDTFGDLGLAASIFRVLGTPTETSWPDFSDLPDAGKFDFVATSPRSLSDIYPGESTRFLELLDGMLRLSPTHRIRADLALQDPWFDETLVSSPVRAWYGVDNRVDISSKCVEERDGLRLVDLLRAEMQAARDKWS